jgi:aryl-alcohol dehydrogenase-like predicted oxidoreductase
MSWGAEGLFTALGTIGLDGARRQLDMALDAGINLVDTADIYSWGRSEEVLGEVLRDRRNQMIVATKARSPMHGDINGGGLSRHHLIAACDASLKRLGMDHIDLYQLHAPDGHTPIEETLDALDTLVQAGKVRYVGISNYAGWQAMKVLHTADRLRTTRPVAHQIHYSLLCRDAEWDLLPVAVDQGLGAIIWSPLSSGLLSGKYRRDMPEPEGTRASVWQIPPRPDKAVLDRVVDALADLASMRGASSAQVALAWTLRQPGVTSLIVGARTEQQLADNLAAADLELTADEACRLEVASRRPLPYPQWQHVGMASDRLGEAEAIPLRPYLTASI